MCSECGGACPKWQGQCPHCGAWNTLSEVPLETASAARFASIAPTAEVHTLGDVVAAELPREPSGLAEFDRVLGGGLVPGAVVLIGGDPGIGKSTLLLQALAAMSQSVPVLYVSGEESAAQVALRARRLGIDGRRVRLMAEIALERILATLESERPRVAVIDSIQTLYSSELQSAPGSVAQVRECAAQLTRAAKRSGTGLVLVGHVTKEGALAGPRVLEHMVDTVLYFEGDPHSSFRLVRAVKNRYGAVNELGVFAMTDRGLRGVANPSALFLSQHDAQVPGSCVLVTQEGTRPLLVEIQALVDTAHVPNPRRLAIGWSRSGWPCCLPWRTGTPASPPSTRMCSSTPSVACASPSPQPTSPCWRRSSRRSATSRCRGVWWRSERWGWRARFARLRVDRNGCARRRSSASRWPSFRRPTRRSDRSRD